MLPNRWGETAWQVVCAPLLQPGPIRDDASLALAQMVELVLAFSENQIAVSVSFA